MTPSDANDAHRPREIAEAVETLGVAKANMPTVTLLTLAVLAGAFISMSGLFYLVAITNTELGFGPTRVLGGVAFSLGLILVVIAGAELFTGNNLIAMAWASRLVGTRAVLRNWALAYVGNVVGCLGTVALVAMANVASLGGGGVGKTALAVANSKMALPLSEAFARGVLCNALVCLAVWLTLGGRSVTDKIVAIIFPITAFVAMGLEHSIANWFFLPYAATLGTISWSAAAQNLAVVTAGNLLGGTVLVATVYWLAYRRGAAK